MTLQEFFATYTLTTGQSSLVDELDIFLTDSSTCFLLKGYAGTGKTFLMKGLSDFLTFNKRSFRIAAPTGRAAKVISQKTKHKAYTIHKTIYSSKDIKEFKVKDEEGTETFKFYYDLKNNGDPSNTVYIIDESSMLSNAYSEGEFFRFGTGYLLKDLIMYINADNNDHHKKIIFIGDDAQLPPVNMNFSPALDSKYLRENCDIQSKEFELTDVVRQKANSGILFNATKIRQSLKANLFNQLDIETKFEDINQTKQEDLLSKYLLACNNIIDDETIIIAHSNSSVKEYNDFVRNHFFPNQQFLTVGDKVILVSNNYNQKIELLNGDFGFVQQVAPINERRVIKLKRKNKDGKLVEIEVQLNFRNTIIAFTDDQQNKQSIECKIIENLLYSNNRDLSSDERKAIYIDFKIRNAKLSAGSKEFKDSLRADPYFNALQIKFGYAVTCHKAQGGEWKNTFLNCKTSMGYFNSSYFRWLYTGITRATENLFTINEPHFQIDSNLQPPRIENILPRQDLLILKSEILEMEIPFIFPTEIPFLKNIFFAISDLLKDANLKINTIKHTSFLEHYTFSQGNEAVVFKIHFNNQNKVSRIEKPSNATVFIEMINSALIQLENKTIVLYEETVPELTSDTHFEFDKPFLKEFYESVKIKIESSKFVIKSIEHKSYCEIYEFKKNGLNATYKFWYDGKNVFKKTEIIPTRTTGLTDEINELLKNSH
ncbi:AAA family ATPase [Mucilaginibacter sp. 5C4]|uniref:ATP-dependent DNA helicase n=1 Tax=Mucilaginibacter sp. 5C4 TaxID=3048589 RepID=UPI002AC89684|nr:AAA family ATPase [Mucilaginibacter sp. 5C4]MEB0301527.1 AAA family ATPase [Mucilaginibacter sp. 5C4]WPX25348.1 AAA family ATPase [Mucilaginibacter sp. 5C4]